MDVKEIRGFLAAHHPFDLLPAEALAEVAEAVRLTTVRRGDAVMKVGEAVESLFVVRKGAVETCDPEGRLLARLGEGECFGIRALLRGGRAVNRSEAIEDGVLYLLPAALFERLRRDHAAFAYFCAGLDTGRLRDGVPAAGGELDLVSKRVRDLLARPPVTVPADLAVREAARVMSAESVSCVMVAEAGRLVGILTDRDLRNRVVARDLPTAAPVAEVMTPSPHRIDGDAPAFDAMLLMSRHNIHHLPVMAGERILGCLTTSTMVESHTTSPVWLARAIHGCVDVDCLREVVARVPGLVRQMVEQGATAHSIGHVVSTLTDAVTVRLLHLAEARLGPPPVPYVWLAAGSQARQEQTALSDQDNCMVIADSYDPACHAAYFRALAEEVCDGLNTCGYVWCPGEMMAKTDQWRQPLAVWRRAFDQWIEQPEPKALMLSCVFFDLRPVHGEAALFEDLQRYVLDKTRGNRMFLAHMGRNALSHEPPIGFFRGFVLIHGGSHDHTFDLKLRGVVPIVDLARVYALSAGLAAVNTQERLLAACEAKVVSREGAVDLVDALEFIGQTRLRHQARLIRDGKPADNFMSPDELSGFERSHLKTAFGVVKTMQGALASTYQLGRF